ncbi:MAG: N-acetylmuramoyl-L-alanine amidase [Thermodesulfovibrionales bacterium]
MKKRILPPLVFLFLFIGAVSAEKAGEVTIRYGKQENAVRIVLDAQDELIKNANTITSLTSVRVDFPSAVQIRKPKDFLYETVQKDRFLVINLRDVVDIKTYKLTAPSRIVIDLRTASKPDTKSPQEMQQSAQKGQKELVAPDAASKVQAPAGQTVQQKQQPASQTQAAAPAPVSALEKSRRLKLLVIDPGHGGYDQGIAVQETREKDLSLALAKDLSAVLAKKGLTVFLTRKTDQPLSLQERISFASSKKPDLLISLHASASNRWSVYTSTADEPNTDTAVRMYSMTSKQGKHLEKSKTIAKVLATAVQKEFRGTVALRELSLPLLASLDAPAVIIEYPLAGNSTYDQKMRERIVKTLLSGVIAYEQ